MHSLLTGTPELPETLDKLNAQIDSIHTRDARNKHQVYNKKENRNKTKYTMDPGIYFLMKTNK